MYARGPGQAPETVIIRTGTTGKVFFGLLVVLWAGILIGIEASHPPSESGRIAAGVIFGFLILLTVGGWFRINRRRPQLEVRGIDIVSRPVDKRKAPQRVNRADGDTLRILPKFKLYGKVSRPRLVFLGRGEFILLHSSWEGAFRPEEVRRACEARGWPFDGDSSLAVRDVQNWLHHGRSMEAVQLMELFGPFPDTATDGEPHIALAAAVYEDVGDKFTRSSRASARDAYRRAAGAQRAFAGYARTSGEAATRLAELSRIEGKAQG
jgi:hypothetical protein